MRRIFALSCFVLVVASCGLRHPAELSWTLDGRAADADSCANIADTVSVVVRASDSRDVMGVDDEPVTAECSAGTMELALGNYSVIRTDLLKGGQTVGSAPLFDVQASGGAASAVNPLEGPLLLQADIEVKVGVLEVGFTVGQQDCDAANPGDIDIEVSKQLTGLDREMVDEATVSCADGYLFEQAEIGETYFIRASATYMGRDFGTAASGHRVNMGNPITSTVVNLIDVELPAE